MTLRAALLLSLLALPGICRSQGYPYFPPPGMAYSVTNGNLTLQNLTLESVTGIVLCDGSSALCAAATAANIIPLWTGTPSSTQALGSLGALISVGSVTGVTITVPVPLTATTCAITTSGTCAITWTAGEPQNEFLATPNGSSGPVGLRAIVAPDLPNLGAAPTATVGPTATTGTASTYLHSDGAPAICLTCSYTWTAEHIWNLTANGPAQPILLENQSAGTGAFVFQQLGNSTHVVTWALTGTGYAGSSLLSGGPTGEAEFFYSNPSIPLSFGTGGVERVRVGASGNVTVDAPGAGTSLTVNGAGGANTVTFNGGATAGQSFGLGIVAGTNSSDYAERIFNASLTGTYWTVYGDGGIATGSAADPGPGIINAQSDLQVGTVSVCRSDGTNCPAGTLGTATFNLTSAGTGTPTISHCRGCSSPSISRVATGEWEMNTGVTLATTMVAVCNVSAATGVSVQALFVYAAAADPTADIVMINFFSSTNTLADPVSGVQVSCIVGS